MHGSGAGIRDAAAGRVAALRASRPEWRGWLERVRRAGAALEDPAWRRGRVQPPPAEADEPGEALQAFVRAAGAEGEPLLHGRTLRVDAEALAAWLRGLLAPAEGDGAGGVALRRLRPGPREGLAWVQAILRGDSGALERAAREGGVDPDALGAVLGLAALPPLHAAWRSVTSRPPRGWLHGHCPLCGGAPVLAELRGLDRARLLRCGRCGGGWDVAWLRCAFCGEGRHERLGSLVPEEASETRRVETCSTCRGYLKSLTALTESPPAELLLRDLETVELDLVALGRGYRRPETAGFRLELHLMPLEER